MRELSTMLREQRDRLKEIALKQRSILATMFGNFYLESIRRYLGILTKRRERRNLQNMGKQPPS